MKLTKNEVWVRRQRWHVDHLDVVDEPMWKSLVRYRQYEDRQPTDDDANVASSHIMGSKLHAPIIDLDFEHVYVKSTTKGHGHLYINVPTKRWRMYVMLFGLWVGGVIEYGHLVWSIRRGGTFMRLPWVKKTPEEAKVEYTYGMFRKLKK